MNMREIWRGSRRVEVVFPIRTILLVVAAVGLVAAFRAIGDTFLVVFIGIFLALVFEYPVRYVIAKTGWSRGLAATVTVLGSALAVVVLALFLLVPLVGGVRDFLHELPSLVQSLRDSDELSWLGSSGAAENAQEGADKIAVSVPDAISSVLGIAGDFFGVFLAGFTLLFICLFLITDIERLKRALASVLMPGEDVRWLGVWEEVTTAVSRWAIGLVVIATIAGTTQGLTAWLLGSSYALALGVIAGLLDMIPNIGATIAGFILVPTLWAEQGLTAAIVMLVVVLVYQQVENNILTPKIQGKAVNLSAFFIILAVTLFGALLGVLGALTPCRSRPRSRSSRRSCRRPAAPRSRRRTPYWSRPRRDPLPRRRPGRRGDLRGQRVRAAGDDEL
jgi:predicted PurR-regulated permease PerM